MNEEKILYMINAQQEAIKELGIRLTDLEKKINTYVPGVF